MVNDSLPIANFKSEIVETIANNQVTVITAETGAGKSTQVPQYLLAAGYTAVVTQPRRLAARTVSERVAEEYGCEIGNEIGFRTAHERQCNEDTKCLFVTDGLALVRELMGAGSHDILVIDEVHEWNLNIEVLVAWAKMMIATNPKFRVVLMSATLEAQELAAYFDGAPVIEVPGRLFPVEEKKPGEDIYADAVELLRQGRNVLVFQPGKAEIEELVNDLQNTEGLTAKVLPLHGELDRAEQAACFANYKQPKCVVSTNVAQTSVTIDDIDAVIDSGQERRIELVNGVEGLYLRSISLADAKQRKGRAGRTKPGIYIDHCAEIYDSRLAFPLAEVMRVRLDQTVLRLAIAGFDMEELQFFHQPDIEEIHEAKRSLHALGCMDASNKVTPIGRQVSRLPVSVQYGRMIVEADKLGVLGDVVTIAAILEQGGITARFIKDGKQRKEAKPYWMALCHDENESDVMAQLAIYEAGCNMSNNERRLNGIFNKAFSFTKERRKHLVKALEGKVRNMDSTGKRHDIVRAMCAGMVDQLHQKSGWSFVGSTGMGREIGKESIVRSAGDWVVGKPFDLELPDKRYPREKNITFTLNLLVMVTKVDPMVLVEAAPQLVRVEKGIFPQWSGEYGSVASLTVTHFNDVKVGEELVADPSHAEAPRILDEQAWRGWHRPYIEVPELGDVNVEIPEIREEVYATSKVDGTKLTAYGYVYESTRWGDTTWHADWTNNRDEAVSRRNAAVARLTELREMWKLRESFMPRIKVLSERRVALGLYQLRVQDTTFDDGQSRYSYTEEDVSRAEARTGLQEAEIAEQKRLQEREQQRIEAEEARRKAEAEEAEAQERARLAAKAAEGVDVSGLAEAWGARMK